MTRFLTKLLAAAALLGAVLSARADDFKIVPTARALFDAAAYLPNDSDFRPGVAMPDVRLGAKANFGNFEARADISMRFGKFYPADIYLMWKINETSRLTGGFFVHQYGLQSATGASAKITMEEPIAQSAFGEIRLLGLQYQWWNSRISVAGSVFAQPEAVTKHANELGQEGMGALGRFLWHPHTTDGDIFQIGLSAFVQSPTFGGDTRNPISNYRAPFPTKVSNVTLASATVDSVSCIFKMTPEVLWSRGRVSAEGQFYFLNTSRRGSLHAFRACGGYVTARILLNRGARYSYSPATGYLTTPGKGLWELVASYSGLTLNNDRAGVWGGKGQSASLTMNYYLHKYITWRVNYTWCNGYDSSGLPARHANIFQTRIQFLF